MTTTIFPSAQPDCSAALRLIIHLSNDELKDLLNNDSKFEEMLKDLQAFKDLEEEREMLLGSVSSLSEFNLNREPELTEGREKIQELSEQGEKLSQRVQEKMNELRAKSGDMSMDTALALLQTAAAVTEEESEKIAQDLLSGEIDIEDFLTQFTEKRKLMHLRKVKAEKMSELIPRQQLINSVPNYVNAPPISVNANYFQTPLNTNSVPYPTGPVHMPFPANYFQNNF